MTTSDKEEAKLVRTLREAFRDGAAWYACHRGFTPATSAEMEAASRYPMPTVEVPRVVKDPEDQRCEWRYRDDGLEARADADEWIERPYTAVTPERVRMWADLIANPTERRQVDE